MCKKRTYQEIYDYFKSQGCELLSTEYINAHQKLQYKCPNGHIHEMTWNNFQRGKRCPKCRDEKLREQRRHDESIVANPGNSLAARLGAPVDGGALADGHVVADFHVGDFTVELEVLRHCAHYGSREY